MSIQEQMDALYGVNVDIDIYLSYSRVADFSKNGPKALMIRQKFIIQKNCPWTIRESPSSVKFQEQTKKTGYFFPGLYPALGQ